MTELVELPHSFTNICIDIVNIVESFKILSFKNHFDQDKIILKSKNDVIILLKKCDKDIHILFILMCYFSYYIHYYISKKFIPTNNIISSPAVCQLPIGAFGLLQELSCLFHEELVKNTNYPIRSAHYTKDIEEIKSSNNLTYSTLSDIFYQIFDAISVKFCEFQTFEVKNLSLHSANKSYYADIIHSTCLDDRFFYMKICKKNIQTIQENQSYHILSLIA